MPSIVGGGWIGRVLSTEDVLGAGWCRHEADRKWIQAGGVYLRGDEWRRLKEEVREGRRAVYFECPELLHDFTV